MARVFVAYRDGKRDLPASGCKLTDAVQPEGGHGLTHRSRECIRSIHPGLCTHTFPFAFSSFICTQCLGALWSAWDRVDGLWNAITNTALFFVFAIGSIAVIAVRVTDAFAAYADMTITLLPRPSIIGSAFSQSYDSIRFGSIRFAPRPCSNLYTIYIVLRRCGFDCFCHSEAALRYCRILVPSQGPHSQAEQIEHSPRAAPGPGIVQGFVSGTGHLERLARRIRPTVRRHLDAPAHNALHLCFHFGEIRCFMKKPSCLSCL